MGIRFRRDAKCNGVLIFVDDEELARFDVREVGYSRKRVELADIHPYVDSDRLIAESMSLWPTNDVTEEVARVREQLELENVRCSECRKVFEEASKIRMRNKSKHTPNGCESSSECEDNAVWVYVQSKNLPADRLFPIPQSYVDIIIRGCLSISRDFARRFLETTVGWSANGSLEQHNERTDQNIDDAIKTEVASKNESNGNEKHHVWINDRHDPMYVRADSEYSCEKGYEIDALIREHHPDALQQRVLSM